MFLSNLVKRIMCNIIKNSNLFFYAELKFNHKTVSQFGSQFLLARTVVSSI